MQPIFPNPTSQFERDLVLQLTKYVREIYSKLDQQTGYAWNGNHPKMGNYELWVDSSNRLRIKNGTPTSDVDGQVVGTQT